MESPDLPPKTHLSESWSRLEPICRRLWEENSPAAVNLQAVMEEFGGEAQRVEQMLQACQKALHEQQEKLSEDAAFLRSEQSKSQTLELETAKAQLARAEGSLSQKRTKADGLKAELSAQVAENVEFHDKFLKAEAAHDEDRVKKMEAFYTELNKKGATLETSWEARHKALEEEHRLRDAALQKKHDALAEALKNRIVELEQFYAKQDAELTKAHDRMMQEMTAWEASNRLKDEALLKRDKESTLREHQWKEEYTKKQLEFEGLKESLQREVAEIVKQYQAKLRNEGQAQSP